MEKTPEVKPQESPQSNPGVEVVEKIAGNSATGYAEEFAEAKMDQEIGVGGDLEQKREQAKKRSTIQKILAQLGLGKDKAA